MDRCSVSGLYQTYIEKKASGEVLDNLGAKTWWKQCPQSVRQAVYNQIYTPPPTPDDPSYCDDYGFNAIFNALSEQCECTNGTVMKNNKCVTPPYCGTNATYSGQSGQCECNYGYKKQGKACVVGNCTANSAYNPKTGMCECGYGYVVKDNKCVSELSACGSGGIYSRESGKCSCLSSYYLKNGQCVSKQSCGLGGTFNTTTETCTCGKNYVMEDGTCVLGDLTCGYLETFNSTTKKCECFSDYVKQNGKCISPMDVGREACKARDPKADIDYSTKACLCRYGYKADSSHSSCIEKNANEFPSNSDRELY